MHIALAVHAILPGREDFFSFSKTVYTAVRFYYDLGNDPGNRRLECAFQLQDLRRRLSELFPRSASCRTAAEQSGKTRNSICCKSADSFRNHHQRAPVWFRIHAWKWVLGIFLSLREFGLYGSVWKVSGQTADASAAADDREIQLFHLLVAYSSCQGLSHGRKPVSSF